MLIIAIKNTLREPTQLFLLLFQPVVYSLLIQFMSLSVNGEPKTLIAVIGASMISMWNSIIVGARISVKWDRFSGILENFMITPTSLSRMLFFRNMGASIIAVISLMITFFINTVVFGVITFELNVIKIVTTLMLLFLSFGVLGSLISIVFISDRKYEKLTDIMNYPIFILSGMIIPITFIPSFFRPFSYMLIPYWITKLFKGSFTTRVLTYEYFIGCIWVITLLIVHIFLVKLVCKRIINKLQVTGQFN